MLEQTALSAGRAHALPGRLLALLKQHMHPLDFDQSFI